MQRPESIPSPRPPLSRVVRGPIKDAKIGLIMLLLGGVPRWWMADAFLLRSVAAPLALTGVCEALGVTRAIIRIRCMVRSGRYGTK